jgi:hypothetical protein
MPRILKYDDVQSFINREDFLLSVSYSNSKELLDIQCHLCNEIYKQTYNRYKQGNRHQMCKKKPKCVSYSPKPNCIKYSTRSCEYCNKDYSVKRTKQRFCSQDCSRIFLANDKENLILRGSKGGTISAQVQKRQSRNEIAFGDLCRKLYGDENIICNERIFKDKNGNYWDCDVFIKHLNIAILWDGWYWHYGPAATKLQRARDVLKRKIIQDNGSTFYRIIDYGGFNMSFVEDQFNLFVHKMAFKPTIQHIINLGINKNKTI